MNQEHAKKLVDEALNTLTTALEQGHSDALQRYLAVMARFYRYSWGNSLLIASQCPNATRVAGFHAWKKLGRHVRKGEKGIVILAPVVVKKRIDSEDAEDQQTRLYGFRTAYVFDESQTNGEPLPVFATVKGDPQEYAAALKAHIQEAGIALEYDQRIAPAHGVSSGGHIRILPGLTTAEEFSVLVHEFAHERLHHTPRRAETTKTIRETEAEAIAFVVCNRIGLDTNTAAADYIQLYDGDKQTLADSLSFIQSTATDILRSISPEISRIECAYD